MHDHNPGLTKLGSDHECGRATSPQKPPQKFVRCFSIFLPQKTQELCPESAYFWAPTRTTLSEFRLCRWKGREGPLKSSVGTADNGNRDTNHEKFTSWTQISHLILPQSSAARKISKKTIFEAEPADSGRKALSEIYACSRHKFARQCLVASGSLTYTDRSRSWCKQHKTRANQGTWRMRRSLFGNAIVILPPLLWRHLVLPVQALQGNARANRHTGRAVRQCQCCVIASSYAQNAAAHRPPLPALARYKRRAHSRRYHQPFFLPLPPPSLLSL